MDKYLVPQKRSNERVAHHPRRFWKRSLVELNGRFEPNYRHEMMNRLISSYTEVGAFPHKYKDDGRGPCKTHLARIFGESGGGGPYLSTLRKKGVSHVDFDNKGIYLASVTKSGCLTVHDFEALYCQTHKFLYCQTHKLTRLKEDESKLVLHLSPDRQLDAVKWNPLNQDEVVCSSLKDNELLIFDVACVSSKPIEVLKTRALPTVHGLDRHKGLSDIAFASNDSRIFASDTNGMINVWDRRVKWLPCLELTSSPLETLNSIEVDAENQIIFGAGSSGSVYAWDVRGGKASATFQSHKDQCYPPLTSVKLATLMEKIGSLKAQVCIVPKDIHSIGLNPSCPYQLAFHLDDGWSGILDIINLQVTHIHCPPAAWLNESGVRVDLLDLRKPSWLSTCSIYLTGSPYESGIHLLDFYHNTSSPCHVDYKEDIGEQNNQNRFIPLSEGVISCAVHPLYNAIVAGTKETSLLVISQRHESCKGEK